MKEILAAPDPASWALEENEEAPRHSYRRLSSIRGEPLGPKPLECVMTTRQNSPKPSKEKQEGHLHNSSSNLTLVHIANRQVEIANANACVQTDNEQAGQVRQQEWTEM